MPTAELAITIDPRIDELERVMSQMPQVDCPVVHRFTPGLYVREMSAPAGAVITSKIHLTEHPFVLSKGRIRVRDDDGEWHELCAPFTGITKPGTRRVAVVLEDVVWTTFHPTNETDVDVIESQIILKHDEHMLGGRESLVLEAKS